MLASGPRLTTLNLENNRVSDDGALHICRGLVRNGALTELNLSGNRLRDLSMLYLASSLAENDKRVLIQDLKADEGTAQHGRHVTKGA